MNPESTDTPGTLGTLGTFGTFGTFGTVLVACLLSFTLGLFFLFVWSPLPWGWEGIDHYHDRAIKLAAGQPFDTTDVPWGYAYYLAVFYRLFGPIPWIPLVAQVIANAFVPLLLFLLVRRLLDERVAAVAALLAGVLSFNTVYASTQTSDAICTVLFVAGLLVFLKAEQTSRTRVFLASGLLLGLTTQFRPNLILFPPVLAAWHVLRRPRRADRLRHVAAFLIVVGIVLTPWIVRTYRLTGSFLPTSTHGGVQLWYGTLQSGHYLESRAYNPRALFDAPAFAYTSLERFPLVATAGSVCDAWTDPVFTLVYWTDRDRTQRSLSPHGQRGSELIFEIPGQVAPTTVYYYVEASGRLASGEREGTLTPPAGASDPFIFFVSTTHLRDMDTHSDLLDVFDLVRLLRHDAWNQPLDDPRLDFDRDGSIGEADVRAAIVALLGVVEREREGSPVQSLSSTADEARVTLRDGSTFAVPRQTSGIITDLNVNGDLAGKLLYARRSMVSLSRGDATAGPPRVCGSFDRVEVNNVFYRREPHMMRRYTALAFDNIRRDPPAFIGASLYRIVRLFVIWGGSDDKTAQQFSASSWVYRAGLGASVAYFFIFLSGVAIAVRRRYPVSLLLLPIIYVPLTICFVLTNMRYSVTVQPLMFVFVAIALLTALERVSPTLWRRPAGGPAAPGRGESRTGPPLSSY